MRDIIIDKILHGVFWEIVQNTLHSMRQDFLRLLKNLATPGGFENMQIAFL